ncbi:MAG: hypothetical protein PHI97_34895 [Desulfobulbus sp.]|nr:hypothetical protein [Desulfobulbus sp.]
MTQINLVLGALRLGEQEDVGWPGDGGVSRAHESSFTSSCIGQGHGAQAGISQTEIASHSWPPSVRPLADEKSEQGTCRPGDTHTIYRLLLQQERDRCPWLFNLNRIVEESCVCAEAVFSERIVLLREFNPVPMYFGNASLLRDALLSLLQWVVLGSEHRAEPGSLVIIVATWHTEQVLCCSLGVFSADPFPPRAPEAADGSSDAERQAAANGFRHDAVEIIAHDFQGRLELVQLPARALFRLPLHPSPIEAGGH